MNKNEFMELIHAIIAGSKNTFKGDLPAIRMLFNDTKDMYHKNGDITDSQVQNWIMTKRELGKIKNILKGV